MCSIISQYYEVGFIMFGLTWSMIPGVLINKTISKENYQDNLKPFINYFAMNVPPLIFMALLSNINTLWTIVFSELKLL